MSARAVKSSRTTNSKAHNFAILNGLVDDDRECLSLLLNSASIRVERAFREVGTVKLFNTAKAHGFIAPLIGPDVFFRFSAFVQENRSNPGLGVSCLVKSIGDARTEECR